MVVAEIKPFWVDEWRVIYNLKYKNAAMLWGPLDFLQQFPRTYLVIIKTFTSLFDYSYFALRLPSWLVGTFTIVFCYRLMNKIYTRSHFNRFLFVMILVSASTFTCYYVQIKQYTMDILLSLAAIWQLIELLKLKDKKIRDKGMYFLLCTSFLIVPFFSYTYPIAIAPVFIIQLVQSVLLMKNGNIATGKARILLLQWFPLFLCAVSISVFFIIDVSQLMADKGMHQYWGHLMMDGGFNWSSFFYEFYNLFAEVGSGLLFWYIFGILGIISFLYGITTSTKNFLKNKNHINYIMVLYSTLLLTLVIILFISGKFPLGEPRLNAFTIPAISILMIGFLEQLNQKGKQAIISKTLSVILYAGVTGNIYTTFFADFTGPGYARKMDIYRSSEKAILLAQSKKIPILITPEIAWPYDKTLNFPFMNTVPGDWVLKTFPAYHVAENIPVYAISSLDSLPENLKLLPANVTSVLAGDGRSFQIIKR